jgi:hypothetical protein
MTHDPLGITPNPQKPNRFDPIGQHEDGLSLYEYVRSDPINKLDQFGLSFWWPLPPQLPVNPFGDPQILECQINPLLGRRSFCTGRWVCKQVEKSCYIQEYPPLGCEVDIEGEQCDFLSVSTFRFLCSDEIIYKVTLSKKFCYEKVKWTIKKKNFRKDYLCSPQLNIWISKGESFIGEFKIRTIVKELVKQHVCEPEPFET